MKAIVLLQNNKFECFFLHEPHCAPRVVLFHGLTICARLCIFFAPCTSVLTRFMRLGRLDRIDLSWLFIGFGARLLVSRSLVPDSLQIPGWSRLSKFFACYCSRTPTCSYMICLCCSVTELKAPGRNKVNIRLTSISLQYKEHHYQNSSSL